MKNKFEKTVYWFNFDNEIEEINYGELVEMFRDETTTPSGVAPRIHVREGVNYICDDGEEFRFEDDAKDWVEDNNLSPKIKSKKVFELWTWGHQGNNPQLIRTYDTEKEAIFAQYETFEEDMNSQDQHMVMYADTEQELKEQLSDFVSLN